MTRSHLQARRREEEEDKKPPSVEEEEEKEPGGNEDVGSDEQELVKKVKEMSVAAVDDGVDFSHDALEATSSAEAELAPDPLKKPASFLPSSSAGPALPDVPMDSSLPASSPTSKEVLPSWPRQPKPPLYSIPDDLAQFLREKPLLRFGGAGSDSDAVACGPPPKSTLPRSSSLKRPKSRGRSKVWTPSLVLVVVVMLAVLDLELLLIVLIVSSQLAVCPLLRLALMVLHLCLLCLQCRTIRRVRH